VDRQLVVKQKTSLYLKVVFQSGVWADVISGVPHESVLGPPWASKPRGGMTQVASWIF